MNDKNTAGFLNSLASYIRVTNERWWVDIATGVPKERNFGEMMALVHSEISEALEADRKQLMDEKLTHRQGVEVELADAIIRILDVAGGLNLDIGGALVEKMAYNARRLDHTIEHRLAAGGKKY